MLRVQSLDHNIVTGTFRVETCSPAGPKAAERGCLAGPGSDRGGGLEHGSVWLGCSAHVV